MDFLRRHLGGTSHADAGTATPFDPAETEAAEREYELEVLRDEQERFDELIQRQIRYASYAWQPPAQGGTRRADDNEER